MVLAMADEITRETLLNLVKEQGEIVRQLKAAQAEKTQVRTHRTFFPLFLFSIHKNLFIITFRHRDRCTAFLFFCLCGLCFVLNYDSIIVSPSLSSMKYDVRCSISPHSRTFHFFSCMFLHLLPFHAYLIHTFHSHSFIITIRYINFSCISCTPFPFFHIHLI